MRLEVEPWYREFGCIKGCWAILGFDYIKKYVNKKIIRMSLGGYYG